MYDFFSLATFVLYTLGMDSNHCGVFFLSYFFKAIGGFGFGFYVATIGVVGNYSAFFGVHVFYRLAHSPSYILPFLERLSQLDGRGFRRPFTFIFL